MMLKFSRCRQGIARYSSLRRIKLPHNILRAISTFPTSILKCERVHISSSSINSSAAAGCRCRNPKHCFSSQASSETPTFTLRKINQENPIISIKFLDTRPFILIPTQSRAETYKALSLTGSIKDVCDIVSKDASQIKFFHLCGKEIIGESSARSLLESKSFLLLVNNVVYECNLNASDNERCWINFDQVRTSISSLHTILNIHESRRQRETELLKRLGEVKEELDPLSNLRNKIEYECEKSTQRIFWLGFAALCAQCGIFARLTWWEYSWDITEPITYFSTFSTILFTLGYYLVTRQNFEYTSAKSRMMTRDFHRRALKYQFDIERFERLRTLNDELNSELSRIRQFDIAMPLETSSQRNN